MCGSPAGYTAVERQVLEEAGHHDAVVAEHGRPVDEPAELRGDPAGRATVHIGRSGEDRAAHDVGVERVVVARQETARVVVEADRAGVGEPQPELRGDGPVVVAVRYRRVTRAEPVGDRVEPGRRAGRRTRLEHEVGCVVAEPERLPTRPGVALADVGERDGEGPAHGDTLCPARERRGTDSFPEVPVGGTVNST
jgi:hypothetical protein